MSFVSCSSPNSDVTSKFTPLSGLDVYAMIDDPMLTPDDSTYAYLDGDDSQNQDVGYPAFSLGANVEKVLFLLLCSRFSSVNGGDSIRNLLYVNGTRYSGANYSPGTTIDYFRDYYLLNPDTGLAWTQADIEGTGANPIEYAGCRALISAGNQGRWYQQFMCVCHQENETGRIVQTIAQPIVKSITEVIS